MHTPDLYDGKTFARVDDGVGYAKKVGFGEIGERGRRAAERLPNAIVYAGFSLGVMAAQALAQTRAGAKGALFFYACLPISEFGGSWPASLPGQVHMMEKDPFALEGDLDAARELAATAKNVELFVYPGDRHLFAENGTPDYEPKAAALLKQRTIAFLKAIK